MIEEIFSKRTVFIIICYIVFALSGLTISLVGGVLFNIQILLWIGIGMYYFTFISLIPFIACNCEVFNEWLRPRSENSAFEENIESSDDNRFNITGNSIHMDGNAFWKEM